MDFGAVFTATILAAAIGTAIMGLWANWPVALAPGMGLNVFFAYGVVLGMGHPWQAALGAVFCSGRSVHGAERERVPTLGSRGHAEEPAPGYRRRHRPVPRLHRPPQRRHRRRPSGHARRGRRPHRDDRIARLRRLSRHDPPRVAKDYRRDRHLHRRHHRDWPDCRRGVLERRRLAAAKPRSDPVGARRRRRVRAWAGRGRADVSLHRLLRYGRNPHLRRGSSPARSARTGASTTSDGP